MFSFLMVLALALSSCEKENLEPSTQQGATALCEEKLWHDMDAERAAYMTSLPMYDAGEFHRKVKGVTKDESRNSSVWGVGTDDRVYKWTGSYWHEPNPAARLRVVEVGSNGTGVWGVGTDTRVYKWTGSYWHEPNPAAGLYDIAAMSADIAVGIGNMGKLYITYNGGVSWSAFTTINNINIVSMGDYYNFLWARDASGAFKYFNTSTLSWETKPNPSSTAIIKDISAMFGGGVWTAHYNSYYSGGEVVPDWDSAEVYYSNNGITFWQPNPAAGLGCVSSSGGTVAWGIGKENKVYKTNNTGGSWYQPNLAARLDHVSSN